MKSRLRGDTSPGSGRFRAGTRNESQKPPKNGASKIPLLVLSLLRNQTEKLATWANATRNPQLLLLFG